jgi:2-amino-4-hydroxy-6-hydroxymethyldihydropteridine diphosphokinase
VYETAPVGGPAQPHYLNAAVLLSTKLEPSVLMERLLDIEASMGRVRKKRNEARLIDLDVLWIEGVTLTTDALVVPHPRLLERSFALRPLLDVVPDARDPVTRQPYAALHIEPLQMTKDTLAGH